MPTSGGGHTVFFDGQYWVIVLERWDNGQVQVCRAVLGAEPSDQQLAQWLSDNWRTLKFSDPVDTGRPDSTRPNPKRERRVIARQLAHQPVGTRSQQALQAQHEQLKAARCTEDREQRLAHEQERFARRQAKRKQRRRGR